MVQSIMFIKLYLYILIFISICNLSYVEELSIEIDGSNLPFGEGEVENGKIIFIENCSSCHGHSGEGLIAQELMGGSDLLVGDNIALTVGNYWPYAPKIFDYIRRAKRDSLSNRFDNNQVYSLTGYILKLNGLYNEKKINKTSLRKVKMPNSKGFISNY